MLRLAAAPLLALALSAFAASIGPLPAPLRAELTGPFWHKGCPVSLSQLRVLTIRHWGFDRRAHTGQLVVNEDVAAPLARVFLKLDERPSRLRARAARARGQDTGPSTRTATPSISIPSRTRTSAAE